MMSLPIVALSLMVASISHAFPDSGESVDLFEFRTDYDESSPQDNSMECQIALRAEKATANIRCRSERSPEEGFQVADLPVQYASEGRWAFRVGMDLGDFILLTLYGGSLDSATRGRLESIQRKTVALLTGFQRLKGLGLDPRNFEEVYEAWFFLPRKPHIGIIRYFGFRFGVSYENGLPIHVRGSVRHKRAVEAPETYQRSP